MPEEHYALSLEGVAPPPPPQSRGSSLLAVLLCWLGIFNVLRSPLNLWLVMTVVAGVSILVPVSSAIHSFVPVLGLAAAACALTGAVTPRLVGNSMRRPVVAVTVLQCGVTPLLGLAAFFAARPLCGSPMAFGTLMAACMPPSSFLSEYATREASGRTFLCRFAALITSLTCAVTTPLVVWALPQIAGAPRDLLPSRWTTYVLLPPAMLCSYLVGIIVQALYTRTARQHRGDSDVILQQYYSLFGEGRLSEMLETAHQQWKSRGTAIKVVLVAVTHYVLLSEVARQKLRGMPSPTGPAITFSFSSVAVLFLVQVVMQVVALLIAWQAGAMTCDMPEDRIAVLYVSTLKSEVLLLPVVFHVVQGKLAAATAGGWVPAEALLVLLSAGLYLVTQTLAVLLHLPLRRWRSRCSCRPGTALLPLRFDKYRGSSYRDE